MQESIQLNHKTQNQSQREGQTKNIQTMALKGIIWSQAHSPQIIRNPFRFCKAVKISEPHWIPPFKCLSNKDLRGTSKRTYNLQLGEVKLWKRVDLLRRDEQRAEIREGVVCLWVQWLLFRRLEPEFHGWLWYLCLCLWGSLWRGNQERLQRRTWKVPLWRWKRVWRQLEQKL